MNASENVISVKPIGPMKPTLRGVSHHAAFYVAALATVTLIYVAPNARAATASAIYGATLTALFGISALYHRPTWSPEKRQLLRRLDHSAIFLLIAGTYTPLFWLLDPHLDKRALLVVWVGAALGVAKSMFWAHAPKVLTAALCLLLGWAVIGDVARLLPVMGTLNLVLLAGGGVIYSMGAIVYARKRPDPFPRVFGYHEIFHALVIAASVLNFVHVLRVVRLAA